MKALITFIFVVTLFGQVAKSWAALAPQPLQSVSLSSPSRKCDIRLAAWCILQGARKVTLVNKAASNYDNFWILQGPFDKNSQLIILEPVGCRSGMSDIFKPLGFDSGIHWHGKDWDRITVKLKRDNSCNIAMLFPLFDHDEMEWAFSSGLMLVRACQDRLCSNDGPDAGELRSLYRDKFERKVAPSSLPKHP